MKLSSQMFVAFGIVILLSVIDSYTNYRLSVKVNRNAAFLDKSEAVILNSGRLYRAIIEMQSGFRGFLLTDDSSFLSSYRSGLKAVPDILNEQLHLVKENELQSLILDSINRLHSQWTEYAGALIEAKRKADTKQTLTRTYNDLFETTLKRKVGKKLNDEITARFSDFDQIEYKARAIHGSNLNSSIQRTHTFSFIFLSLTIVVGVCSTIFIIRLILKRIKTMVYLAEAISKGDFNKVEDKHKDELTRLSTALNTMSEKLNSTIQELEKKNIELDKFAYVVSHDLKAPLRGIHNAIQWIEEDLESELSPQMKNYLGIIPQRTKRMEDLINGLLEYARIRTRTAPEKADVDKMVKDIADLIVPRDFEFETKNLPVFYTERLKLEQVFTNLLSNAVKYTLPKTGRISVSCRELPGFYEFSVRDNGIGIDPEYHDKIFGLFQTLRDKDEKESTGIGLAIIKKILDDQHCSISVNSISGSGAEFVFTWPRTNSF